MTRSETEEAAVAPTPKKTAATTRSASAKRAATNGSSTARSARTSRPKPAPAVAADVVTDEVFEDDDEQVYAEPSYPSLDTGRHSPWRILGLLGGLVAVLLVAALIFLVVKVNSQNAANSRRNQVLSVAQKYGVYLSSYSYKNLTGNGSDWQLVTENATPSFNKDFSATSGTLGQLLKQYNATATGKVVAAGVQSVSSSRAVVLLFIDQTVTNTANKTAPVSQPLRVVLTMLHQHGKWLIDSLELPT